MIPTPVRAMSELPLLTDGAAPEWEVEQWFHSAGGLNLSSLRGRVVMLETFQMLCPGCVSHGLPQAQRVQQEFSSEDLQVVGLHTVFEHHDAMGPVSLRAFLHEYRISFPVGVDRAGTGPIPRTMDRYELQGTPSVLLFDREGRLRSRTFGQVSDLRLGRLLAGLIAEPAPSDEDSACTPEGCSPPEQP